MGGGELISVVEPHNHHHVLGRFGNATDLDVSAAIDAAAQAAPGWRALSFDDRAAILLKAADLLAGSWRQTINAATMLGQSKSPIQAEIDAACELIDFWRYNVHFARRLLAEQPESGPGSWNRMEYRPLEGFVLAITPFNFTSIAGNLPTAPALLGNTVVIWKPSPTAQLSAHYLMRLLEAAGLPPGVINLVTGSGQAVSRVALPHRDLAGIHFTGSTGTFQHLWRSDRREHLRATGTTRGWSARPAARTSSSPTRPADPAVLTTALVRERLRVPGPGSARPPRAATCRAADVVRGPRRAVVGQKCESITMGDVSTKGPVDLHGRGHRRPGLRQARRSRARPGSGATSTVRVLSPHGRHRRQPGLFRPAHRAGDPP